MRACLLLCICSNHTCNHAVSVFRSYWFPYHIAMTHIKTTPFTCSQEGKHLFQKTKYTHQNELALALALCREAQ